jgi:dimethylargininase
LLIAITREVSPSIVKCELTHLERQAIDFQLAQKQHRNYQNCLQDLGCQLLCLPVEPDLPDSVFVEDTAVVLDEVALLTRPGAASRRLEVESVAEVLKKYRKTVSIQPPGTLDGGDVLKVDKTLYIGLSSRSNRNGIEQARALLAPYGYNVKGIPIKGCLHLKSAVTLVAQDTLLINRRWLDPALFGNRRFIDVEESEPYAANSLLIRDMLIFPANYPKTQKRLEAYGIKIKTIDLSELIKAEGAVTCCSLVFNI